MGGNNEENGVTDPSPFCQAGQDLIRDSKAKPDPSIAEIADK